MLTRDACILLLVAGVGVDYLHVVLWAALHLLGVLVLLMLLRVTILLIVLHYRSAHLGVRILRLRLRILRKLRVSKLNCVLTLKSLPVVLRDKIRALFADHGLQHVRVVAKLQTLFAHLYAKRCAKYLSRRFLLRLLLHRH